MKAAVYGVRVRGTWQAWVSLDIRMDLLWWLGEWDGAYSGVKSNALCERFVLLRTAAPLGQATGFRDQFQSKEIYDKYEAEQWDKQYCEWQQWWTGRGGKAGFDRNQGNQGNQESGESINAAGKDRPVVLYDGAQGISESDSWLLHTAGRIGSTALEKGFADLGKLPPEKELARLAAALSGRSLLAPELKALLEEELPQLSASWRSAVQLCHLRGELQMAAAVARSEGGRRGFFAGLLRRPAALRCLRCGSVVTRTAACASCGQSGCAYCEACLALGRSRECALLLRGSAGVGAAGFAAAAHIKPRTGQELDRWGLSPAQREAATAALQFLAAPAGTSPGNSAASSHTPHRRLKLPGLRPQLLNRRLSRSRPARFLLWAVTGAGKTEMIFPLLSAVLESGGRALVATPRRDVVLELAPRLAKAFPQEPIAVLYGGSGERWQSACLVLATTHQLLRFSKAFDLVIIDELDAYPYHNDPMLAYAAEQCCKDSGHFIFLSATPPRKLQQEAATGRCGIAKVPARFHGHPLPVPERISFPGVQELLNRQKVPAALLAELKISFARGAQMFLFVSRIKQIGPLVLLLRKLLPGEPIEGTSSQDEARSTKVLAFRDRHIRLLVTTTILERGVTVPRSDVFILDADSSLFDEASLVQMAGRAGRSKDDPAGRVRFFSTEMTSSQHRAIRQIRQMNQLALRKGFLLPGGKREGHTR